MQVEHIVSQRDRIISQLYLSTRIARLLGVGADGGRRACRTRWGFRWSQVAWGPLSRNSDPRSSTRASLRVSCPLCLASLSDKKIRVACSGVLRVNSLAYWCRNLNTRKHALVCGHTHTHANAISLPLLSFYLFFFLSLYPSSSLISAIENGKNDMEVTGKFQTKKENLKSQNTQSLECRQSITASAMIRLGAGVGVGGVGWGPTKIQTHNWLKWTLI